MSEINVVDANIINQNGDDVVIADPLGDQSGSKENKSQASDESLTDKENDRKKRQKHKKVSNKKRKKHRRRERNSDSTSSAYSKSSSEESGTESDEDDNKHKRKKQKLNDGMFHVKSEEEEHHYNLPENIVDYIHHYMAKYIPDKELKEKILVQNPVPTNVRPVHHLDEFLRDIMKDEKKSNEILFDSVLEKVQGKSRDVLGPLSKMWLYLHETMKAGSRGESVDIDVEPGSSTEYVDIPQEVQCIASVDVSNRGKKHAERKVRDPWAKGLLTR